MTNSLQTVWQQCLADIKRNIPKSSDYCKWFEPLVPVELVGKKLILRLPSEVFCEKLEGVYASLLSDSLSKNIGKGFDLEFEILNSIPTPSYSSKPDVQNIATDSKDYASGLLRNHSASVANNHRNKNSFRNNLQENLRFDNYICSDSNAMVYNAAKSIVQNPGSTPFNPLFIYGASGVGKTHMLHAIGNDVVDNDPNKRVVYVTAQLFKLQYVEAAYKRKRPEDFIHFYQNMDVLLMDDIQELRDAVSTQQAFFQIFNNLRQLGKQIILTSDRPPADLEGLENRLYTRMKWGLTSEIQRPDISLRKQLLQRMLRDYSFELSKDVCNLILDYTNQNIRDLEGIVKTMYAHQTFGNTAVNLSLANTIVKQHVHMSSRTLSCVDIVAEVCRYYKVEKALLKQKNRKRPIVIARQVSMYLCKELTSMSLSAIGKDVAQQDHSTVLYAHRTIKDQLSTDPQLMEDISTIKNHLLS